MEITIEGTYEKTADSGKRFTGSIILSGKKCQIENGVVIKCENYSALCGVEKTSTVMPDPNSIGSSSNTSNNISRLPIFTSMDAFITHFNGQNLSISIHT
jgi:hypothetical protein